MPKLRVSPNAFYYEVAPHEVDDFALQLEGALHEFAGGFQSETRRNATLNLTRYTFLLDGQRVLLRVAYTNQNKVILDLPAVGPEIARRVEQAVSSLAPNCYVGFAVLSFGFSSTSGLIDLDDMVLAPMRTERLHGMPTGSGVMSTSPVRDHVVIFPVAAYSPLTASLRAGTHGARVAWLLSFLFQHPVAVLGEAATLPDPVPRPTGYDPQRVHALLDRQTAISTLQQMACETAEPGTAPVDRRVGLFGWPGRAAPIDDAKLLYAAIRMMDGPEYDAVED